MGKLGYLFQRSLNSEYITVDHILVASGSGVELRHGELCKDSLLSLDNFF